MDPITGGAIITGVGGLLNNLFGRSQSRRNIDRTHRHQMALSEYQYGKELEMWNRANAYNHPVQQMNRLSEAGINPHLAYMKGTINNVTSTRMPEYQAPTVDYSGHLPFKIPNMLGAYQDIMLRQAQTNNVEAMTREKNEMTNLAKLKGEVEAALIDSKIKGGKARARSDAAMAKYNEKTLEDRIDLIANERQKSALDIKLKEEIKKLKISENEIAKFKKDIWRKKSEWAKGDMSERDSILFRKLAQIAEMLGISMDDIINSDY